MAKQLGNIGQLVLCNKVTNSLRFIDPISLQIAEVPAEKYWRDPLPALATIPEMIEFLVLDIEPTGRYATNSHGVQNRRLEEADAQVSPLNAASFGEADAVYHTRTHLGAILQPATPSWATTCA